jgi:hypothetical protein
MASPFVGKDGSRHTNHDSMKRANARFAAKQQTSAGPDGYSGDAEDEAGLDEQNDAQDGATMAAEHGPAVEVNVMHDHEGGRHSVHARHPDGHEHESEHSSADEAHRFAGEVSGVGGAE